MMRALASEGALVSLWQHRSSKTVTSVAFVFEDQVRSRFLQRIRPSIRPIGTSGAVLVLPVVEGSLVSWPS